VCGVFDPGDCGSLVGKGIHIATDVVTGNLAGATGSLVQVMLTELAAQVSDGLKSMIALLGAWVVVPSTDVCPGTPDGSATFVQGCVHSTYPAAQLRSIILPITILVAVCSIT
jgi:hypothetical protein